MKFQLKVQQIDRTCIFDLTWGKRQSLNATVPFPDNLPQAYHDWQNAYLTFYKTALRGRVAKSGFLTTPAVDWHSTLVQAEAKLLYEFHQWLRCGELYEMRSHLTQTPDAELFLTCQPLDLARFPWEAWELPVRLFRVPSRLQDSPNRPNRPKRAKMRVLAIFGDETGLDFQRDRKAVEALSRRAEVVFVGWQTGQPAQAVKERILSAIADPQGWDIIFFAGHSNETELTGGELGIAPGASMQLSQLLPALQTAQQQGLQFVLFNSCQGLSLAHSLIEQGFGQVAIMREPVHNQVANTFLLPFLEQLTAGQDVGTALNYTAQHLKLHHALTYPSAHLIPSLFRHPDTPLFRLQPVQWRQKLRVWLPSRREAIIVGAIAILSSLLSVQGELLDRRVQVQGLYRQLTQQLPQNPPPVLLVQIDNESLQKRGLNDPKPIDRTFLADITQKLIEAQASVIGIDYLLDRADTQDEVGKAGDRALAQTITTAQKQQIKLIFGSRYKDGALQKIAPTLANPQETLHGNIQFPGPPARYIALTTPDTSPTSPPPFSYLLVFTQEKTEQPTITWSESLPYRVQYHSFNRWSYRLKQMWFHPIIDFSISPQKVYTRLPAWELLESPSLDLKIEDYPIVIIAPGGYAEAGIEGDGEDNFPLPPALADWRNRLGDNRETFTGGEVHAYFIHHFQQQHFILPLPDLWFVLIAAILGRGWALQRRFKDKAHFGSSLIFLCCGGVIYGVVSLQVYISAKLLLPWFLPTLTFWVLSCRKAEGV